MRPKTPLTQSQLEKWEAKAYIGSIAFQRVRDYLARELVNSAIQVRAGKYSTDYEIRCYVVTPDQLEKYVQRRPSASDACCSASQRKSAR